MKYRFLLAIVIIIALLGINVYAVGYEYTISASDNFITASADDDLSEVSKKLNITTHDLNTYFTKNGLIYLAVSLDNQTQVRLSAFNDNFSSRVNDISYLDENGIAEFIDAISEDSDSPAQLIENNGRKFLCVKDTLRDSGGVYTVTQYITICNNKTFYFAGYNPGEDTSDEVSTIFKTFDLQEIALAQEPTIQKSKLNLQYVLINGGVVFFGLVAIATIVSIVISHAKKEDEENNET